MTAQVTANMPTPTQGEGSPTGTGRSLAVDTITEFTSANGVTVDKALTASAGLTTTTVTASGAISGTTITGSGAVAGTTGTFSGAVSGTTGTFSGAVSGTTITGSGAIAGTTGTFSGAVTATSITGTGAVTGLKAVAAVTADGAITVGTSSKTFFITKAGVAAMTIVDPTTTTHDGLEYTFVATTANAHTLSNAAGSGFFSSGGSSKDVATFGGAIGDGITIIAYQGKWYIDPRGVTNITLG